MFAVWSHFSRFSGRACGTAVTFAVSLVMASPSVAQTACIRCTGPEGMYICTATSDEPFRNKAVGLFCAAKISAERQHHSCAALRDGDPCSGGVSVTFAYDGASPSGSMMPPAPIAEPAEKHAKKEPEKNGEPETLTEFAKETVDGSVNAVKKAGKATGDAIQDTGRAIGDATKKTLKCLGSALNDC